MSLTKLAISVILNLRIIEKLFFMSATAGTLLTSYLLPEFRQEIGKKLAHLAPFVVVTFLAASYFLNKLFRRHSSLFSRWKQASSEEPTLEHPTRFELSLFCAISILNVFAHSFLGMSAGIIALIVAGSFQ